jgi:hypothetical protein
MTVNLIDLFTFQYRDIQIITYLPQCHSTIARLCVPNFDSEIIRSTNNFIVVYLHLKYIYFIQWSKNMGKYSNSSLVDSWNQRPSCASIHINWIPWFFWLQYTYISYQMIGLTSLLIQFNKLRCTMNEIKKIFVSLIQ